MSFSQDIKDELKSLPPDKRNASGMFLRRSFIESGSVSDPGKSYHFEIVAGSKEDAILIREALSANGLTARTVERKGHFVVYIKEADQICDAMAVMGARKAVLDYENIRVLNEVRGQVNRRVNCETANIKKQANAAHAQIEDINLVIKQKGIDYLSPNLRELAQVRLANPESSLKELGELMDPPVSKSCVNHRLAKISEIAAGLR